MKAHPSFMDDRIHSRGRGQCMGVYLFISNHSITLFDMQRGQETIMLQQIKKEASKNAFEEALRKQLQKPTLQELVGKSLPDSGKADENKKTTIPNSATRDPSKAAFRKTPGYVWPEYVSMYDQQFYFEYEDNVSPKTSKTVFENLNSHRAASLGKLSLLKEIAETQGRDQLFKIDHNGWRPIHEAARGGHADIIEYLVKEGAKPNERTNFNEGGSPLYWAKTDPIKNAKAIAMLEKYGGVDVPPLDKSKKGGKTDQKDLDTEKKTSDKDKDKDKDKQEM
uniref:Uncharacterized protein n=1 Tax=Pseudo-nitzschia australis TaxID=44445 RepID=A0A7S4EQX9_9STRA